VTPSLTNLGIDLHSFKNDLDPYLDNIVRWIGVHFPPSPGKTQVRREKPNMVKNPDMRFDKVIDIEENIWTPTIGIKGKIDVSFQVVEYHTFRYKFSVQSNRIGVHRTLALELKTGKSYESSIDHQTQVLLYCLMLSEVENSGRILPGMLLYLKDNRMREIVPKPNELKGVLNMRYIV